MHCLVDTGSCVTLMNGTVFDKLCTKIRHTALLKKGPLLRGVNGISVNVRGQTSMKFDCCEPIDIVIVDDSVPDCILGIDFLRKANAKLLVGERKIVLYDKSYVCNRGDSGFVAPIQDTTGCDTIDDVLEKWKNVFSTDDKKLGRCIVEPCNINTGDAHPVKQRPYRMPLEKRKVVEQQIREMLDAKVIRPSSSPWASPVVLVPKKDGSIRFCTDYRQINSLTIPDSYSLPSIQEIFDLLGGAVIFSTIDLTSGYWQIPLDEESIPKTAFCTHWGNFEYTRMPFGLRNAPAIFQRTMNSVLHGLIGQICFVYLDDIVVFSKSTGQHAQHLEMVFDRLNQADLMIKKKKCEFGKTSLDLLGYTLRPEGISPQESKLSAIRDLSSPTNKTEVRSFLGMVGYYRQCIPQYAELSRSMQNLTGRKAEFKWTPECEQSFQELKNILTSNLIMAYPQPGKPYKLYTDACNYAVGAILVQEDENGVERPVHYLSKQLTSVQQRWATIEKEAYGIVYALQKLRPYLWGAEFTIFTDHKPLKSLFLQEVKNTKIQRWAVLIAEYGAPIKYREGKNNIRADMLSRIKTHSVAAIDIYSKNDVSPYDEENAKVILAADNISIDELVPLQKEHFPKLYADANIEDSEYVIGDQGILYSTTLPYPTATKAPRIILPPPYHKSLCDRVHAEMGHLSVYATIKRIQDLYVWKGMVRSVKDAIAKCPRCATRTGRTYAAPMSEMPIATYPFEIIGVDLTGPLATSTNGNKYMLTIIDHCSGWAEAFPIPDKKCATVEKKLKDELFPRHGYPRILIQDNGLELNNATWLEDLRKSGVEVRRSTVYHPQTNGRLERYHRTLKNMLNRLVDNVRSTWEDQLPSALLAYRNSVSTTTGFSPFFLLYGRHGLLPLSLKSSELSPRLYDHQRALDISREMTRESRRYNRQRLEKRSKLQHFEVGDHVVVKAPPDKLSMTSSYDERWMVISQRGPVVWLRHQLSGKERVVNVDKLILVDPNIDWDRVRPRPKRCTRPKRVAQQPDEDLHTPIAEQVSENDSSNKQDVTPSDQHNMANNETPNESRDITEHSNEEVINQSPDVTDHFNDEVESQSNDGMMDHTGRRRSERLLLKRRRLLSPAYADAKRAKQQLQLKRKPFSPPSSQERKRARLEACMLVQRFCSVRH